LLIFKELYSVLHPSVACFESLCSSAAEEREYEVFFVFRQPLISLRLRFLCRSCYRNRLITLTFFGHAEAEANYSKALPRRASAQQ
ncbi:hypothetical protein, partial [Massilia aurea]|uniref:hypothetical protein n=1 Tax=Massilia aurea TaxID=373040 RepID=UPI001C83D126